MSFPPINYETIKDNVEFQSYLFDKRRGLYMALWGAKYDINQVPFAEKKEILRAYKQFVEAKETLFPSGGKSPTISRQQIIEWLDQPYRIKLAGDDGFIMSSAELKTGLRNRLLPILENIAKEMPQIMNIIMKNKRLVFEIVPEASIMMTVDGKMGGMGYRAWDETICIGDYSIVNEKENIFKSMLSHEMYHAFDFLSVDTTIPGLEGNKNSSRKEIITFSDIVNQKLKNRKLKYNLDTIADQENEKMKKYRKAVEEEQSRYGKAYSAGLIQARDIPRRIEENLKTMKDALKIWRPIYHGVRYADDRIYNYALGVDSRISACDLTAYALQAYYNGGRARLRKFNRILYDIIEKEFIPYFK